MRFCIEIIDFNHDALVTELTEISLNKKRKRTPVLMNYAWSQIDFTQRFYLLYKKLAPNTKNNIEIINNWAFRNALQHFTSNLDKVIQDKKQLFGALKWGVKDDNGNLFSCLAVSGISGVFHNLDHTVINVAGKEYEKTINEVSLEISVFDKKEQRKEINLSELMENLNAVVKALEDNLSTLSKTDNLKFTDWSKHRDILVILRQEPESSNDTIA